MKPNARWSVKGGIFSAMDKLFNWMGPTGRGREGKLFIPGTLRCFASKV